MCRFHGRTRSPDRIKVEAGVNNLFGSNPPICFTCTLNGYDAGTYDCRVRSGTRGRRLSSEGHESRPPGIHGGRCGG